MKTLNLAYLDKSEIKYHIDVYPDSQPHIAFEKGWNKFSDERKVKISTRISNLQDLFILRQVCAILDHEDVKYNVFISYLLCERTERRFSMDEAIDLDIIKSDLATLNTNNIEILEEHTDSHHNASIFRYVNLKQYATFIGDDTMFVFPDKGASERHPVMYNLLGYYDKQRVGDNIEVKFNQQKLLQEETDIIVLDDICDGGGTFIKVAEDLHKRFPNTRIHLFVTHAIQKSGIEKVAALYDWVFITNSYKSWELEELPDNVQVISVI